MGNAEKACAARELRESCVVWPSTAQVPGEILGRSSCTQEHAVTSALARGGLHKLQGSCCVQRWSWLSSGGKTKRFASCRCVFGRPGGSSCCLTFAIIRLSIV